MLDLFSTGADAIRLGSQSVEITKEQLKNLREMLEAMLHEFKNRWTQADNHTSRFIEAMQKLEGLAQSQQVTQSAIDDLTKAVQALDAPERGQVLAFLNGISSSIWASGILKMVGG
jgi:hypothetical protein